MHEEPKKLIICTHPPSLAFRSSTRTLSRNTTHSSLVSGLVMATSPHNGNNSGTPLESRYAIFDQSHGTSSDEICGARYCILYVDIFQFRSRWSIYVSGELIFASFSEALEPTGVNMPASLSLPELRVEDNRPLLSILFQPYSPRHYLRATGIQTIFSTLLEPIRSSGWLSMGSWNFCCMHHSSQSG